MRLEIVLAAHAERHPDKVAVICEDCQAKNIMMGAFAAIIAAET